MPARAEGTPLLPRGARAPPPRDTRIYVEESGNAEAAALGSQGLAGGAAASGPAPREDNAPGDWRTRGIFATVDPKDTEKINGLRERVDTRLHAAARAQDLAALEALLAAGAPPAALDWEGRTPLHLCVAHRLMEPLRVLLRVPGIANVRDASGLTLLRAALLHGWRGGARAVLDAGATVGSECENEEKCIYSVMNRYPDVEQSKFSSSFTQLSIEIAMDSGDMEMFEMILNAAKREGTLEDLNGSSNTALISAIKKSNLPAIQALLSRGASLHIDSEYNKTTAVHAAVHDQNILEYLLDYPGVTSSIIMAFDDYGQTPLHAAITANNAESLSLLIDKYKDKRVKTKDDMQATPLQYAVYHTCYEAAKVILEKDSEAMNDTDWRGDTPLIAAARHGSVKIAVLLLEKGGLLSTKDKNGVTVLELISSNFYEASNTFENLFDKFVSTKKVDDDIKVSFDYRMLTNEKGMSQINVLEEFVRCGQSKVLIHPLIESLLHLKWLYFLPVFYAMLCVYAILLVSVNFYVIIVFYHGDMTSRTTNSTFKPPGPDEFPAGAGVYWLLIVLMYGSISLLLLQELFAIYLKRLRYFESVESWVKLVGLALCAGTPPLAALAPGPWPRHAACAALLLAWLQAMFLVSRFSPWGYYGLLLGKVAMDMLKILTTVIFLVIGFVICFMIQFRWATPFDGPFTAFVKTLVMMSSELDYEGLFGEDHDKQLENTKTIVRFLFLTFAIFMAIVLMNLMTGVAVDNISELNKVGNIQRLEKQIALLSYWDYFVYDGVFAKWLKKCLGRKRYISSMDTLRSEPTLYVYTPSQLHCYHYTIETNSSRLHNGIIETVNKKEHRAETEQHNATQKDYKRKINELYNAIVDNPVIEDKKSKRGKQKQHDSGTLRQQINTMFYKVTHDIEELKCQLLLQSKDISTILKEIEAIKGAGTSND